MSKLTGVKADASHSYNSLERIAEQVRGSLGMELHTRLDPVELFENIGAIVITDRRGNIPLWNGVEELEDSEGYARYVQTRGRIEVIASSETYSRLERRHPRAGYLVAHELGHCLLHTDQLVRLAQMPANKQTAFHRGLQEHKPFQDTEWQANAFASALLMPARGLAQLESATGGLDASAVSDSFGTSYEAARYRLETYVARKEQLLKV